MIEPENQNPEASELGELKEQCAALRSQTTALLLALVVLSGTFSAFLFVQARRARGDLVAFRPQANQIAEASKREEPAIRDFFAKLNEFGRTHPDFLPVLNKYKIQTPAAPATATTAIPSIAPAPKPAAPAPTPKK